MNQKFIAFMEGIGELLLQFVFLLGALLIFAQTGRCQTFSVEVGSGMVHIEDAASVQPPAFLDTMTWEYILHGDCQQHSTGRIDPAAFHSMECPSGFESGFLVEKVIWFGWWSGSTLRWSGQHNSCYVRGGFDSQADTIYQPVIIEIPHGIQSPDWYSVHLQSNQLLFQNTNNHPGSVEVLDRITTDLSAQWVDVSQPLPSGLYNVTHVLEWQQMIFVETDMVLVP